MDNTAITYEFIPRDEEEMHRRFTAYSASYPYLIWEEAGELMGYAYASRYKSRAAYSPSVEISIYLHKDHRRKGIGRKLLKELLETLRKDYPRYYTAVACINYPNEPSQKLFEKEGFVLSAKEDHIAYKMGQWRSTVSYFLPLRSYDDPVVMCEAES